MLFRRFAAAFALLIAALASQLPEFTQQYRQRLGGAIDELQAMIARFDSEAAGQSLTREQGITRLKGNDDRLAQERGVALDDAVGRADRLTQQRDAFRTAGPVSQYAILAESLDSGIASQTVHDYQPAAPLTGAGLVAAIFGFASGWLLTRLVALPFRRRSSYVPQPAGRTGLEHAGLTASTDHRSPR